MPVFDITVIDPNAAFVVRVNIDPDTGHANLTRVRKIPRIEAVHRPLLVEVIETEDDRAVTRDLNAGTKIEMDSADDEIGNSRGTCTSCCVIL